MLKVHSREFGDDVVRVGRNRPDGVTLEQVAADYSRDPSGGVVEVAAPGGDPDGTVNLTR